MGVGSSRPPESSLSIHRQIGRSIESHIRSRGSQLINQYSQWNVSGAGTMSVELIKLFTDRSSFLNCGTCDLARAVAQGAGYMGDSAHLVAEFSEFPVGDVSGT